MNIDFERGTRLIKAVGDETRARILQILSCGELCACDIQDYFDLTQPTLSHHLAILVDSQLVLSRKDGKWTYYRISGETFGFLETYIRAISQESDACPCKKR